MKKLEKLFSLKGKTALVTGSHRGLGNAIAAGLADAGAHVILNGRSAKKVHQAVEEFRSLGRSVSGSVFDITVEDAVNAAIREISADHGAIDILVNNAGIQRRNLIVEMSLADFRSVIETNLTAAFILSKAVVPQMLEREEGKIINMCSLMSELARPSIANYSAAKGGLQMLTRSMAAEWGRSGIQVNGIAPGYFETELTKPLKDDPKFDEWICGRTPSGRWGNPEELQALAIFLSSAGSSYVNGQVIFVDGGLSGVV